MASDPDTVLIYDCHVADAQHAVPGPDVRIMRIGDGGFVVACRCGPEDLVEADESPHPITDHLVNIYAQDPSPEQWLRLERNANGWYDTTRWDTPTDPAFDGTHGQRRANFREQIRELVDADDGRDLEPSPEERHARGVACPNCGASKGRKCQRPGGHRVRKPHAARLNAAREAGVIDTGDAADSDAGREQAALDSF